MKNYIQHGHTLEYTVPSATTVTVGQAILLGSILAVVLSTNNNTASAVTGEIVTMQTVGVVKLTKTAGSGTAIAQGGKAYWDDTAKTVTGVASGNTHIGYGWVAAVNADTSASVKLLLG